MPYAYYRLNKRTLAFCLLSIVNPLHAATWSNYAEMATALAKIPVEAIARHEDRAIKQIDANDPYPYKTAAFCHLKAVAWHVVADSISLFNKALSFYNRTKAESAGFWDHRDYVVNGMIALHDLAKWYQHVSDCLHTPTNDQLTAAMRDDQEASVDYALSVVGLPCLDGLAAFALACAQEGATRFAGKNARFVASVAQGLVRLVDEYAAIKENSQQKKLLLAVIVAVCAWLIGEVYECCKQEFKEPKEGPLGDGNDIPPTVDGPKKPDEDGPKNAECDCLDRGWVGGPCPHRMKKMITDEVARALSENRKPIVRYHNATTGPYGSDESLNDDDIRRILADDKQALENYEKAMQANL